MEDLALTALFVYVALSPPLSTLVVALALILELLLELEQALVVEALSISEAALEFQTKIPVAGPEL